MKQENQEKINNIMSVLKNTFCPSYVTKTMPGIEMIIENPELDNLNEIRNIIRKTIKCGPHFEKLINNINNILEEKPEEIHKFIPEKPEEIHKFIPEKPEEIHKFIPEKPDYMLPKPNTYTQDSYKILSSLGVELILDYNNLPPKVGDISFKIHPFYIIGDDSKKVKGRITLARGKALIYLLNSIDQKVEYPKIGEHVKSTPNNVHQQIKYNLGFEINTYSTIFSLEVKPTWCKLYLRE